MGGSWSGRYGRRSTRRRVEEVLEITTKPLRAAAARAGVSPAAVDARVSIGNSAGSYAVRITTTPQPFGGERLWFLCPACDARKAKLYLQPGHGEPLACRTCHNLTYTSQSLGVADRWRYRAKRLFQRASCSIDDDFYYRPKGMHWTTFHRLIDAAEDYERGSCGYALRHLLLRYDKP